MPHEIPADTLLAPLRGPTRSIRQLTTTFQLVVAVLDPFTYESAWILETAGKVLRHFGEADCRVGLVVTANEEQARLFCGPWTDEVITYTDPDYTAAKAMGLSSLPALVHIDQHHTVRNAAEGWDPTEWRTLVADIASAMSWTKPVLPSANDLASFTGAPIGEPKIDEALEVSGGGPSRPALPQRDLVPAGDAPAEAEAPAPAEAAAPRSMFSRD